MPIILLAGPGRILGGVAGDDPGERPIPTPELTAMLLRSLVVLTTLAVTWCAAAVPAPAVPGNAPHAVLVVAAPRPGGR